MWHLFESGIYSMVMLFEGGIYYFGATSSNLYFVGPVAFAYFCNCLVSFFEFVVLTNLEKTSICFYNLPVSEG